MRMAAFLVVLALTACSQVQGGAVQQERRSLPRVVSLNPCSDAILAQVAEPEQILALSHFSSDPASSSMDLAVAARFPSVTGTAEEVLSLRPDMVFADPFVPPATRAALERSGIDLVTMPIARSVDDSREQVKELARLTGNEGAGIILAAQIDAALARAAAPRSNVPIPAIVWQSGGIVPGRDTLVADLLAHTGFVLQSAARGMTQADYLPLEHVLAAPPRAILIAGDGRAQENRLLDHPALNYLAETRRIAFDSSLLWCGGPTIIRAAEHLAQTRKSL